MATPRATPSSRSPGRSTASSGGPRDCAIVRALDFELEPSGETCCPGLPSLDVRCNGNGRVTGVLVSEQMTRAEGGGLRGGTLPENLGQLTEVYVLWAHSNNLTGEIPKSLGHMRSLNDLNLRNNSLTGSIPDVFSGKEFDTLNLSNNRLSGPVPLLPYMSGSCHIVSYAPTERNSFTCLEGDPRHHRGACYDNLRALELQPCNPVQPHVAHDVPLPATNIAPPPAPSSPSSLPAVVIVLISISGTAAFVSLTALLFFACQQRKRRKNGPSAREGSSVAYAKVPASGIQSNQPHQIIALPGNVIRQPVLQTANRAGGGLVIVMPKQASQPGVGEVERVLLMSREEEESLYLPQGEVEIPGTLESRILP